MPSTSKRQEVAMRIASSGNSTLGIPKKVGQEFVKSDKAKRERRRKNKDRSKRGRKHG